MKTFTDNFSGALAKKNQKPVTLIVIELPANGTSPAITLRLADRGSDADSRIYNAAGYDWYNLIENIGMIDTKANSQNGALITDAHISLKLLNHPTSLFSQKKPLSTIFTDYQSEKALVTFYQWFEGEGLSSADLVPLFKGALTGPESWDDSIVSFDCIQFSNIIGKRVVGRLVTKEEFPGAPDESIGQHLPIAIGDCPKVPAIPLYKALETKLRSVLLVSSDTARVESTEGWPLSGTFIINDDEIGYTGKTANTFIGVSGQATYHYDKDIVVQKLNRYPFAVVDKDYPIKSLGDVYLEDGLITDLSKDAAKGIIILNKKPSVTEPDQSAFLNMQFDTIDSSSNAAGPDNAIDPDNKTSYATITQAKRTLAAKQINDMENIGPITRVFAEISHFASGQYPNDSVDVQIDGIGSIGSLSRPGVADKTTGESSGGDTVVTHLEDITSIFSGKDHSHATASSAQITQSASSGVIPIVLGNGAVHPPSHAITFPAISGTPQKITYTIDFTVLGVITFGKNCKAYLNSSNAAGGFVICEGTNRFTLSYTTSGDLNSNVTTVYIHRGTFTRITMNIVSISRKIYTNAQTTVTPATVEGSNTREGSIQDHNISIGGGSVNASTNTVTDRFEITSRANGDWDWFKDRVLKAVYTGSADGREVFILHMQFVVEFTRKRLRYTDKVYVDVKGVKDDSLGTITGTSNKLIERPDHIFKWSLIKLLGLDTDFIDSDSFTSCGNQLDTVIAGGYRFAGLINEKKQVRRFWEGWGKESRCPLYFDQGKAKLFYRPDSLPASVKTLTKADIHKPDKQPLKIRYSRSRIDQVINSIDLKFIKKLKTEDYMGLKSAKDSTSINRYGKLENPEAFMFEFVRLDAMALNLAQFYLKEHKNIKTYVELETFLPMISLEPYDTIKIDIEGLVKKGVIIGAGRQLGLGNKKRPDIVKLTIRME